MDAATAVRVAQVASAGSARIKRRLALMGATTVVVAAPLGAVFLGAITSATTARTATADAVDGLNCSGMTAIGTPVIAGLPMSAEQRQNAAVIMAIGVQKGIPVRGQEIAIATAIQEAKLVNLNYGDRDSLGLFQQRPSQGWGSPAQIMSPSYAAAKFYDALLAVVGWETMPLTVAAQSVQHSATPDAYAAWEAVAKAIVGRGITGGSCTTVAGGASSSTIVNEAHKWLGTPYVWGGGGVGGPSGVGVDGRGPGFDCSGLVMRAVFVADGITLPRIADDQIFDPRGKVIPKDFSQMQPGDIIAFSPSGGARGTYDHIGIYDGNEQMIHAPQTGENVQIANLTQPYWQGLTWRIVRFGD